MAGDVPAGIVMRVRKKGARARYVFLGTEGVDLKFDFVAFVRDGEDANAMDRGGCRTEPGNGGAEVEPSQVEGIGDKEECGKRSRQAGEETDGGRGWGRMSHMEPERYSATRGVW